MNPGETPRVEILLATYNGATYLLAQLESIFNQSNQNWRLIARDDGSHDGTLKILENAKLANPERITLLEDQQDHLGAIQSFARLMASSSAPYLMFCDQDDVWHPDKIEKMLAAITRLEGRVGAHTPVLVHCDLRVVDEDLSPRAASFWKYQKLDPRRGESFNKLLIQNVVTGSAVVINRCLCELALPIPPEAAMHDWWLALTAAAFGKIETICEALVDYRQHPTSHIGAKEWGAKYVLRAAFNRAAARAGLEASQSQARAFYERFMPERSSGEASLSPTLAPHMQQVTAGYANLPQMGFFQRRGFLLKHDLWKTGLARNLGLLVWA